MRYGGTLIVSEKEEKIFLAALTLYEHHVHEEIMAKGSFEQRENSKGYFNKVVNMRKVMAKVVKAPKRVISEASEGGPIEV